MGKIEIIMRCMDEQKVSETVLASFSGYPQTSGDPSILSFPGLVIHINTATVLRNGVPIEFNHSEFSMLCHLAKHPGIVLTKDQLYTAVYGENHFNSNTVPNTICRIRNKIEPNTKHPIYIKTVIGMGYKFSSNL